MTNDINPAEFHPAQLKEFHFHVEGHGTKVACAPVVEANEERAFKAALNQCKRFTLPGWTIVCEESGATMPVAQFFDFSEGRKVRA